MSIRLPIVALALLAAPTFFDRALAGPAFAADVYVDGELRLAHLKRMSESATEALRENTGQFFNGSAWECYVVDSIGVCFQIPTTPVLPDVRTRPLMQSFEIFFNGYPWRPFVSWSEIEAAVASGEIDLVPKDEVYKITIPEGNGGASGKMAENKLTWGSVKALFR